MEYLIIKESIIAGEKNLGVFAARTFKKNDIVGVYCGKKGRRSNLKKGKKTNHIYKLDHYGKILDIWDEGKGIPFYFGAHFCNDPYFGKTKEEVIKLKKASNTIKHNCKFEGLYIRTTGRVLIGQEMKLEYNMIREQIRCYKQVEYYI